MPSTEAVPSEVAAWRQRARKDTSRGAGGKSRRAGEARKLAEARKPAEARKAALVRRNG